VDLAVCCLRFLLQTLVKEGIKGIYKGISAPLATVALFNAVLFASRGQMEVLLKHIDGEPCGHCQCCCCSSESAALQTLCLQLRRLCTNMD
jgi:hypothetical protein